MKSIDRLHEKKQTAPEGAIEDLVGMDSCGLQSENDLQVGQCRRDFSTLGDHRSIHFT